MVCMTWTANGPVRNPCVRANRDKLISVNFGNLILTQRLSSHSGNIGVDTVYRDSRDSLSIVRNTGLTTDSDWMSEFGREDVFHAKFAHAGPRELGSKRGDGSRV